MLARSFGPLLLLWGCRLDTAWGLKVSEGESEVRGPKDLAKLFPQQSSPFGGLPGPTPDLASLFSPKYPPFGGPPGPLPDLASFFSAKSPTFGGPPGPMPDLASKFPSQPPPSVGLPGPMPDLASSFLPTSPMSSGPPGPMPDLASTFPLQFPPSVGLPGPMPDLASVFTKSMTAMDSMTLIPEPSQSMPQLRQGADLSAGRAGSWKNFGVGTYCVLDQSDMTPDGKGSALTLKRPQVPTLLACMDHCETWSGCTGIEYTDGQCELWTKTVFAVRSSAHPLYKHPTDTYFGQCLRFVPEGQNVAETQSAVQGMDTP